MGISYQTYVLDQSQARSVSFQSLEQSVQGSGFDRCLLRVANYCLLGSELPQFWRQRGEPFFCLSLHAEKLQGGHQQTHNRINAPVSVTWINSDNSGSTEIQLSRTREAAHSPVFPSVGLWPPRHAQ
ncbi:uncharacterized protein M6G45_009165 isoform 2-T4 [Spheniscus humboldti]